MYEILIAPFLEFPFLRRALIASIMVSCSSGMIGVFLVMQRLSLIGDALSHGILPGIAIGFIFFGFSLPAMSIGGMIAGVLIALLSFWASRYTNIREDSSFAAFYLISLALGVIIITRGGTQADLMHILFGSVLAIDKHALMFVWGTMISTFLLLAIIYRPLVLYVLDPIFLQVLGVHSWIYHSLFLVLVVLNLVAGFQALGSLMAVGLLMLPAITSQLWARSFEGMFLFILCFGFFIAYTGLILSYHFNLPSGPAIISIAGMIYLLSLLIGRTGGVLIRYMKQRHKRQ